MFKVNSKGWLRILKQIMQQYVENIDGSFIEERQTTIVWNYKNAEEEHGAMFANQMYLQIKHLIGPNAPIETVQGNGFLEVKPIQLKKQKLLSLFLKQLTEDAFNKVDFLLYIGADTSDEPVYEYLRHKISLKKNQCFEEDCKVHLVVLGKKPSKADFYVEEIELRNLLSKIGTQTKRRKKNRSYSNLN